MHSTELKILPPFFFPSHFEFFSSHLFLTLSEKFQDYLEVSFLSISIPPLTWNLKIQKLVIKFSRYYCDNSYVQILTFNNLNFCIPLKHMPYLLIVVYFISNNCESIHSVLYVHCNEQMDVITVIMFMTLPSLLYVLTFCDYTFNVIIP